MENRHPVWFYAVLAASALLIAISYAFHSAPRWQFTSGVYHNDHTREVCRFGRQVANVPGEWIDCVNWETGKSESRRVTF